MKNYSLILFAALCISGCVNNTKKTPEKRGKFKIENIHLDTTRFITYQDSVYPDIKVEYLKFTDESDFSKNVNKKINEDLTEIFNDALQEGTPEAEDIQGAVNAFAEDYFTFKEQHPDAAPVYEAFTEQEIVNQNQRTVVLKTDFYLYMGGAHGYNGIHFLNFDAESGNYLSQSDFIADISGFTGFAEEKFREKYEVPADTDLNAAGFFFEDGKFALPENIAFGDDQIILLYNPYEAASYAQGKLRLILPKNEVEEWLTY